MKNGTELGFEKKLWAAADKLRGRMDPSEYKKVVLSLLFLKFISDRFDVPGELETHQLPDLPNDTVLEDRITIPEQAKWSYLLKHSTSRNVQKLLDEAAKKIESHNPTLRDTTPIVFQKASIGGQRLLELVRLFDEINLASNGNDTLGRVYEYFLSGFANAEGQRGGEFYTPPSVVNLLVKMLAPYEGSIYDPCCGSGGMFVQSWRFLEAQGRDRNSISIFGQESNPTTWRLARMNMAVHSIAANLGKKGADTFFDDLHPSLKADYILANPPFNMSDWGQERLENDPRWVYGLPPGSNGNFAWLQHMLFHLSDNGLAGFVLSNGSLSANQAGEGKIRESIINDGLVDCIVSLPAQLFYSTQIPVCLWFLARNKADSRFRTRKGETLFIDARDLGYMTSRVHRALSDKEIAQISNAYRSWRGDSGFKPFANVPGFARSVTISDIVEHKYTLVPGRYVGFPKINSAWGIETLRDEFKELESRLEQSSAESTEALMILKGLVYGRTIS
jgi:type I restriction enzyme M protein